MNKTGSMFLITAALAIAACAQASKEAEASLIGYWKSDEATVELRAKNVAIFNGQTLQWGANAKIIALANDEGSLSFPYVLKGDVLTVWVEDRKVIYKRIDAAEASKTSLPAQTNRTSGSIQQDLVGKWCYSANVNAIGGGRQSDICFTLSADGTYEYYGEASNSNVYGGSNSQSWDYGRWSATATTLTAHSNSGKTTTYSLEKRNHPKTGDPMLMIDGDAFVTYYQRRPW